MKTGTAIAAILAAAAVGAAAAGWITSWHQPPIHANRAMRALPPSQARLALSADLAGAAQVHWPLNMPNPLGDSDAVRLRGKRLYVAMNCAGCHAYDGTGNMGPNLADPYWIYGGTPAAIYRSIDQGHPKGMPAWGEALPPESIWQITAYVGSLGGGIPPDKAQAALQGDYQGGHPPRRAAPGAAPRGSGDDSDPQETP